MSPSWSPNMLSQLRQHDAISCLLIPCMSLAVVCFITGDERKNWHMHGINVIVLSNIENRNHSSPSNDNKEVYLRNCDAVKTFKKFNCCRGGLIENYAASQKELAHAQHRYRCDK